MFCRRCGANITEGSSYCGSCGAPVPTSEDWEQAAPVQYAAWSDPLASDHAASTHRAAKAVLIVSLLLILAGLVFCGWYLASRYGEYAEYRSVADQVTAIETRYRVDGYVPENRVDDVLTDVSDLASSLKAQGELVDYHHNDDCVFMMFASGIAFCYIPTTRYLAAGDAQDGITVIEPSYGDGSPAQGSDDLAQLGQTLADDGAASTGIASGYAGYSTVVGEAVDLDAVRNLSTSSIVIWEGHGCYDSVLGPLLVTGQEADFWGYVRSCLDPNRSDYARTYNDGVPYQTPVMTSAGTYAVTAGYVSANLEGRFDDRGVESVIFLGTCSSCRKMQDGSYDTKLVQAFIDAGADVVFACDGDAYTGYLTSMCDRIFTNMAGQGTTSNKAMPASQALLLAQGSADQTGSISFTDDAAWASSSGKLAASDIDSKHTASHIVCFTRGSDGVASVASDDDTTSLTVR